MGSAEGEWFAGPQWLLPLLRTYFADRNLAVTFVYDGGALVGVVPLISGATAGQRCTPVLSMPVNTHVRRIGMLSRGQSSQLLATVLEQHISQAGVRSCVAIRQVLSASDFERSTLNAARTLGLVTNVFEESRSAVIDVHDGWDHYVATRTGEQLHPLRRRRKMDKAGGWQFRLADTGAAFDESWQRLLHVERRSWKERAGTSISNEPGADAFYGAVARANAAGGTLRLHLLEHQGVPVAHTLGVVHGHTYYLLKHSYDEAHKALSPGFQLLWHVMRESVTEGCTRIDLLGDAMSWKVSVATSLPSYGSYMLFRAGNLRCQQCRLTNQVLKPMARRLGVKRILGLVRGRAG